MKRLTGDDENVLRAIVSLEGDVRWEKVKKWFEESKSDAIDRARFPGDFGYNAGMLCEIYDLCEQIEKARETLKLVQKV